VVKLIIGRCTELESGGRMIVVEGEFGFEFE
jgi:hypothetical protein